MALNNFKNKLENGSFTVGILGLGYVGLPLAIEFANAGVNVIGFDIDRGKIDRLSSGETYILDVKPEDIKKHLSAERISFTDDFSGIKKVDALSICVPTPLSKSRVPDLSYIVSAMKEIEKYCHEDMLIVLESTTYPGTTSELIAEPLKKAGFKVGENIFVAFSPERVDPGNKVYHTQNTPKVLGGITKECSSIAELVYSKAISNLVLVDSTEEAEMVKLLENTFRAVNIALVNELCQMSDRMGINFWNVINAAKTKPFGFMSFYPGPGIGGHCIPLDPTYLSWKAKMYGHHNRFIELASDINENMPRFTVDKIIRCLNESECSVKASKVLILGLAYKKNVNDLRESPSLEIWRLLNDLGANLSYFDPYVPEYSFGESVHKSIDGNKEDFSKFDLVVICTDHDSINYEEILENSKKVLDCRNALKARNIDTSKAEVVHL